MNPIICAYGPITIYAYGLFVVLGLLALMITLRHNPRFNRELTTDKLQELLFWSLIIGFTGGRILYAIAHPSEFERLIDIALPYDGGFSVLGGVIALALFLPWFAHKQHISALTVLDAAAVHGPLMHAIARIGCLYAGCCYGAPFVGSWAITYTNPASLAPLHIPLHPTQLYSALSLFVLFIIMRFVLQQRLAKPGMLAGAYLLLAGIERGLNDIWRSESELSSFINLNQSICISMVITGILILLYCSRSRPLA